MSADMPPMCDRCDGIGAINNRVEVGDMAGFVTAVSCPTCGGTGIKPRTEPMPTPLPCPVCGPKGKVDVYDCGAGVTVSCSECADGDCSGDPPELYSTGICGGGKWAREAIADWNQQVEDYLFEHAEDDTQPLPRPLEDR